MKRKRNTEASAPPGSFIARPHSTMVGRAEQGRWPPSLVSLGTRDDCLLYIEPRDVLHLFSFLNPSQIVITCPVLVFTSLYAA